MTSADAITTKLNIVSEFINQIKSRTNPQNCLKLVISEFNIFEGINSNIQTVNSLDLEASISAKSRFDLILGDLPTRSKAYDEFENKELKIPGKAVALLKILQYLDQDGHAIILLEPSGFSSVEGIKVEDALNAQGYFVNAIFKVPKYLLKAGTPGTSVLALISREQNQSLFVAELLELAQAQAVVNNYFSESEGGNFEFGTYIPHKSFQSFNQLKIKRQIDKLKSQYKGFEQYTFEQIAKEINIGRPNKDFIDIQNSIYIPYTGRLPVTNEIPDTQRHKHYIQMVLNEKAISGYMWAFFKTELGQLVLDSLSKSDVMMRKLCLVDIKQLLVPLPEIEVQKQILETQKKMYSLKEQIDDFDKVIALNPTSSEDMLDQVDDMLNVLNMLTNEGKVRQLLRRDERKTVEFKRYLLSDGNKKNKQLKEKVFKTIVAFLNTEGGNLLIGIDDKTKEVIGVNTEIKNLYKNSTDEYLLSFTHLISAYIGIIHNGFVEYNLVKIEEKYILHIECDKSTLPYYFQEELYYRIGSETKKIPDNEISNYINTRFELK